MEEQCLISGDGIALDTSGRCFICSSSSSPTGQCSINYLTDYLKLNAAQVFHKRFSVPPSVMEGVQRSKLKAALCQQCIQLNEKFSELYKLQEKIRIEMVSGLKMIHCKMKVSGSRGHGRDNPLFSEFAKGCIADVMREEIIEKCLEAVNESNVEARDLQNTSRRLKSISDLAGAYSIPGSNIRVEILLKTQDGDGSLLQEDLGHTDPDPGDDAVPAFNNHNHPDSALKFSVDEPEHFIDDLITYEDPPSPSASFPASSGAQKKFSKENTSRSISSGSSTYLKYSCRFCQKQFKGNVTLRRHIRAFHVEESANEKSKLSAKSIRSRECPICLKTFKAFNTLQRHIKYVHEEVREEKCSKCNKLFKRRHHLKDHMKTCMGPKSKPDNYICDLCGRGFTHERYLRGHYRDMHQDRKYLCSICGKGFPKPSKLQQHHESIHLGMKFSCLEPCTKSYTSKQHWREHVKNCKLYKAAMVGDDNAEPGPNEDEEVRNGTSESEELESD